MPSIGGCTVPIGQGESLLRIPWTGGTRAHRGGGGLRWRTDVVGGGIVFRMRTTLGGASARAGG